MSFDIERNLRDIAAELDRAERKFPDGFHSGHEGWAVIREELDELWRHVRDDTSESFEARRECIQIAAMALRFIKCLSEDVQESMF